jgi:hypothetical protein
MAEGEGVDAGESSSYHWDFPRNQADESLQIFTTDATLLTALISCFLCTTKRQRSVMRRWLRAGKAMLKVFSFSCVDNKRAFPLDIDLI